MTTVREATFDFLRRHGMTTMFGNPGSTELPMLAGFPDDFKYVLGLQEAVVVGMADGYAQASGRPTLVNLHTAPGVGNAMGAIFNAQANKSPLVITAGQQVRADDHAPGQPDQPGRDPHAPPVRQVELRAAARRGRAAARSRRATHLATLPPRGPGFVSIPMDDWGDEVDDGARRPRDRALGRRPGRRRPEAVEDARRAPRRRREPRARRGP